MGGYAITPEERTRIAELLRQQNRATYRAIAQTLGRSVQPVFEIAAALVDAGKYRCRASDDRSAGTVEMTAGASL